MKENILPMMNLQQESLTTGVKSFSWPTEAEERKPRLQWKIGGRTPELDHEKFVQDNVFHEEVEVEGTNNIMNSHMLNTEESGEEEDDVIPDVDYDNNGFISSSSENDSDENRSTQSVGKGSAHGNYRETNIANHEVEDEHIDDALYPEDMSRRV
ncbi:hypothetical protein Fot_21994 [Forsythia ovata]|uniref:Uncharacterized protein n=1 Tax=Forsythia ovata TaxID=205694 RepID=A0ABD1UWG5_9LAMI